MNLKSFFSCVFVLQFTFGIAQICYEDTSVIRDFTMPTLNQLSGYHSGYDIPLPGESVVEKGLSFMEALIDIYPTELGDKELAQTQKLSSVYSTLIVYSQHANGVLIEGNRVWLSFDSKNHLRSFSVHLVMNELELDTIFALVDTIQVPENYKVIKINGSWTLQENFEPVDPELICEDDQTYELQIAYPIHTCCSSTVVRDVGNGNSTFLKGNSNNPRLCGLYANMLGELDPQFEFPYFQNILCNETTANVTGNLRPPYESIHCYYHLNEASDYIDYVLRSFLTQLNFNLIVKNNILFDPFAVGSATGVTVNKETKMSPPLISFKGIPDEEDCEDLFNDYAEDADFVAGAIFELMIRENFIFPEPTDNEGLATGTVGFLTWRYMRSKIPSVMHDLIGNYGGKEEEPGKEVPINLATDHTYFNYSPTGRLRDNASIWASTLEDIYSILDTEDRDKILHEVLFMVMATWNENTDQFLSAIEMYNQFEILYQQPDSPLSRTEFCAIVEILRTKYADHDPNEDDGIKFHFLKDLYIKDTYEGEATGEDIGLEPNQVSLIYDRSPSVWNCRTVNCTQNQRPAIGQVNYLRISVHDQGCDWSDIEGVIEVYVNLATTSSTWPLQWGGDINNDQVPDPYYITYNGFNILAAQFVGDATITNAAEYEDLGDERIYTIPWTPWNPMEEDPYNKSKFLRNMEHQGYLVRIVSTQDPMAEELAGYTNINVKKNNNIAQRKAGIIHPLYESNETISPILATMIIRHNAPGVTPGSISLKFDYFNPGYVMTDDNFDSLGVVRVECSPELLATFINGLPQGPGHIWINDSTFQITGKDFDLPLWLAPGIAYPVVVEYIPNGTLVPVSFRFSQIQEDGCYEGGQYFDVRQDFISPRTSYQREKNNAADFDSITGYPNPAFDTYTIVSKGKDDIDQLSVYNTLGEEVYNNRNRETKTISTRGWPEGLYVIEVRLVSGAIKTLTFVHLD